MRLLARFLAIAGAVWIVAAVVPGVTVRRFIGSYLLIALLCAARHRPCQTRAGAVSFPLLLLTLGLFLVIGNGEMLGRTALLTDRLTVDDLGPAVIAALVISAVTWTGDNVLG